MRCPRSDRGSRASHIGRMQTNARDPAAGGVSDIVAAANCPMASTAPSTTWEARWRRLRGRRGSVPRKCGPSGLMTCEEAAG